LPCWAASAAGSHNVMDNLPGRTTQVQHGRHEPALKKEQSLASNSFLDWEKRQPLSGLNSPLKRDFGKRTTQFWPQAINMEAVAVRLL
jgi:hypothetical protein